ncbi:isocitrate lyase/PEP mutase family protein [Bosea sp. (in: a-proteobacteria)]|uniref:isocitrate lyase/PEP mutase family protein n=1 Tax=Bosea sp. (in: a-proteobacteria) TaxID=1871050 RepID=UPI00262A8BB3|nr:isocitrate lyase/PEP mutase family protein [Bosea sp. (in: a-proteobacteria)]MCO5089641.1 isocitrate lyase/PEP mutase family protein [Bosea sp. (in: a-proteobacteria)]
MSKARFFRELIARQQPIVTPTAHDALSARMLQLLGFDAIALGGSSMLAARYGLPDIGLAGFAEMLETARDIVTSVDVPAVVDADDGYGDVKSVVRTVHAYEEIGVAALILEDQRRAAKRPGDSAASSVVDIPEMRAKLEAAVRFRKVGDTMVVARTDSYALEGADGAIRRCEAYLKAGADGIFVPGVTRHEDLAAIAGAFPGVFKLMVQVEGSETPWLSPGELFSLGYNQIAYPSYIMNRMLSALESACQALSGAASARMAPPVLDDLAAVRARFNEAVQITKWNAFAIPEAS